MYEILEKLARVEYANVAQARDAHQGRVAVMGFALIQVQVLTIVGCVERGVMQMKPAFQVPVCVEETRHVVQQGNVVHQLALVCLQGVKPIIARQCAGVEDVTRQLTGASWHAFSDNASKNKSNKLFTYPIIRYQMNFIEDCIFQF